MLDKTREDIIDHAAIREQVRDIMEREGLTQRRIATESGVAYGTLTPFLGGTYKGDLGRVAGELQRWLDQREAQAQTHAVLPKEPPFVRTSTAEDIFTILQFAQNAPDFGVVVGGAGIGKTRAITEYARRYPNVHVVTAEPKSSTPHNLLSLIAEEIGMVVSRADRLSREIAGKLRNTGGLVVVDEAQHLTSQALDQLRATVLDRANCGVMVSGNESVYARLQGAGEARNAQFAQLYSRVGMRKTQPTAKAKDIAAILDAWPITDDACRGLLTVIARKPGALRNMNKTIRLASMIAGGEAITPSHIKHAWSQLSATALDL